MAYIGQPFVRGLILSLYLFCCFFKTLIHLFHHKLCFETLKPFASLYHFYDTFVRFIALYGNLLKYYCPLLLWNNLGNNMCAPSAALRTHFVSKWTVKHTKVRDTIPIPMQIYCHGLYFGKSVVGAINTHDI